MTAGETNERGRRRWLAVLARASREELEAAVAQAAPLPHEAVRAPEAGMVMLRGRVGGTGDAFNLGEAAVTRCAVRMGQALGVGYTLGRDKRKAELVAVLDALLQDPARQVALMRAAVEPLAQAQASAREMKGRSAATSKVEFFTMVRGETA